MPQLTESEWQRLVPLLRNIDINRQQAAYLRIVQGHTLAESGSMFGYSPQDVSFIVKSVMRWWEKLNSMPDKPKPPRGWVALELIVPRKHVDDVRRVVEALYPHPEVKTSSHAKVASPTSRKQPAKATKAGVRDVKARKPVR
jgi:hypothetical protein